MATLTPITIAAPGGGGTTKVGPDLVATGTPAWQAGATGFGQERSATSTAYGTAVSSDSSDIIPASDVWTIEGVFSIVSPSDIRVMLSAGGKFWIGVNSFGRITVNYSSASSGELYLNGSTPGEAGTNPIVSDGARHHVALVANGSNGVHLFLDGALVAASAAPAINAGASAKFNVGTHVSSSGFVWNGTLDEVAGWSTARYTAAFTKPTAPYVGNETGLLALYHLNGDFNAATY
jgi:hypothetical protein